MLKAGADRGRMMTKESGRCVFCADTLHAAPLGTQLNGLAAPASRHSAFQRSGQARTRWVARSGKRFLCACAAVLHRRPGYQISSSFRAAQPGTGQQFATAFSASRVLAALV
ncbi:uncharacterized protein EpC_32400 [Erwinia pyrifoliae Ep1/96]|nr:uncharacterized protein EpC_32400 [Erwinia pyrifoliae Ep1/96]